MMDALAAFFDQYVFGHDRAALLTAQLPATAADHADRQERQHAHWRGAPSLPCSPTPAPTTTPAPHPPPAPTPGYIQDPDLWRTQGSHVPECSQLLGPQVAVVLERALLFGRVGGRG
jgi:hypothetical protein